MSTIRTIKSAELTVEDAALIGKLLDCMWPPDDGSGSRDVAQLMTIWRARHAVHFVIGDSTILAHAMIFRRDIITEEGPLKVGALASVCVHPDYRGNGWGADVVRAAFAYLPELNVPVSLFQTSVPAFYEKLGCRSINNRFFDGTRADGSRENPFWNPYQIVYPASFSWPSGDIDLNGPGY